MTAPPSPPTGPSPDARDPQVAAWLAVDPLDEVTRARLVRGALAAAADDAAVPEGPRHRFRRVPAFAAAAALVGVLAVGLTVVVREGANDATPTAIDRPASRSAPEALEQGSGPSGEDAAAATPAPQRAAPDETLLLAPVPALGDLGDVSTGSRLARATRAALTPPLGEPTLELEGCAAAAGLALGTPVAVGTGTVDGEPATIVVATQPSGSTAVVAVRGPSCGPAVSVVLP